VRHRADIDGLRAIAVVPVVLFHAGVSRVSGGFVGVDIFFVISGYLITSLILGEMAEGRFSLASFYERRIRRIFPALFAVLAVCVVVAALLFLPRELKSFDRSLLATTFFVSNIYFYSGLGYFAAPPDTLPLLHTWSLAIEEQFYIVFPLLLSLVIAFGRRVWIGLIAALFLLSLAASIWVTRLNPDAAFYLAPMRVWELMLGALLAARLLPRIGSQAVREMLALAGIALIGYAVFAFSPATPFPGSAALIPCLGAALVIYAGEDDGTTLAGKVLSLWPLAFVGLISYSLYLWHWPLLVFARYWTIVPLTVWQSAAIVTTSFILAAFSWRYIEQPFLRKRPAIPRRILLLGGDGDGPGCRVRRCYRLQGMADPLLAASPGRLRRHPICCRRRDDGNLPNAARERLRPGCASATELCGVG
jgi:peptidoglycan/LPS O-acetylase OafA/YrhL